MAPGELLGIGLSSPRAFSAMVRRTPETESWADLQPRQPTAHQELGGDFSPLVPPGSFPLLESMNPRPDRKHREDLPARRIECRWYGVCLDRALASGWAGFSCEACGAFEPDSLDPERTRGEIDGCVALWWAVEHPEEWLNRGLW